MSTCCEKCVFVKYNKSNNQVGCLLNRIEKFKQQGAVIEMEENTSHFTIKNRTCSAFRKKEWANDKDKNNLEIIVRAEILCKNEIFLKFNETDTLEDLSKTVSSLENQILRPSLLAIMTDSKNVPFQGIVKLLQKQKSFDWRIDRTFTVGEKSKEVDCIFTSFRKCNSPYFTIANTGAVFPEDYLANIDESVNEKLMKYSFAKANIDKIQYTCHYISSFFILSESALLDFMVKNREEKVFQFEDLLVHYLSSNPTQICMIKKYEDICSTQD